MHAPGVELVHVNKQFQHTVAVQDLCLTVAAGEFFALLGPRGCGKTTTLRLIRGLETPDSGLIRLGGHVVNALPPYRRRVNLVFQRDTLFPHLTVQDNIAFGLRVQARYVSESDIRRRLKAVCELMQLTGLETRRPAQLSGDQPQRVALARALILQPEVLLLDEPFGALERQVRQNLQEELRRLQRELGTTFLYVTQVPDEALSLASHLAVMHQGRLVQQGTPQEVFQTPRTRFVAEFLGPTNILPSQVIGNTGTVVLLETASGLRVISAGPSTAAVGSTLHISVRPESIQVVPHGWTWTEDNTFPGRVLHATYLGAMTALTVALPGDLTVVCHIPSRLAQEFGYQEATAVLVGWQAQDGHIVHDDPPPPTASI